MPHDAQDGVCDGGDGFLMAAAGSQTLVLACEIGVLGAGGCMGGFDQPCPEPHIALASSAALTLASALVVARADAGPRRQVPGAGKAVNVRADLGEQNLCRTPTDTSDGVK